MQSEFRVQWIAMILCLIIMIIGVAARKFDLEYMLGSACIAAFFFAMFGTYVIWVKRGRATGRYVDDGRVKVLRPMKVIVPFFVIFNVPGSWVLGAAAAGNSNDLSSLHFAVFSICHVMAIASAVTLLRLRFRWRFED